MQKELLRRIIKKEIKQQRKKVVAPLIIIRKKLILAAAKEIVRQSPLPERYWNIFVDATEAECNLWPFLQLEGVNQLGLNIEGTEQLLSLYERWQRICEFLIDEYECAPSRFKREWTKDNIIEVAAHIYAVKVTMLSDFAERKETMLTPEHFLILKDMIDWVRFVAIGEDRYLKFLTEMRDAMQIVGRHPHFARSSVAQP